MRAFLRLDSVNFGRARLLKVLYVALGRLDGLSKFERRYEREVWFSKQPALHALVVDAAYEAIAEHGI